MLGQAISHVPGINWETVGVLGGAIIAALAFLTGLQARRNKAIRDEITEAVILLDEAPTEKLETKVAVAQLTERVARLEGPDLRRPA